MSKKTNGKKSATASAEGETFFDQSAPQGTPAGVTNAAGNAPGGTNEAPAAPKRHYKPRAKASASKGDNAHQAAWQAGFKAGQAYSKLGK